MSNLSPKVEQSPSNKSIRKSNAKDVPTNNENTSRTSDGSQGKTNQFRSCHCPASNMVGLGDQPNEEKAKRQKVKKLTKYDCKRVDVTPFFIYLLTLHLNQKKTSQMENELNEKNCCQTSNFLLKKIIDRVSTVGHASYGGACGKCNNEGCGTGSSKCCDCGGEDNTQSCQCNQASAHEKCFQEFDKKYGDFHAKVSKLLSQIKPEMNPMSPSHKCPCTREKREEIDPEILRFCRHMKTQRPYGDERSEERLYPFPSCKSQINQEDRLRKIIDAIIRECADEGILKERLISAIHESNPASKPASHASFAEDKKYITADSVEAFVKKEVENVLKKHDIDCINNFSNCGCKEKATCPVMDKKPPIIDISGNYCTDKPPIFGPCMNCGCQKGNLPNVPSNVYYFLQENSPKIKKARKSEKVCQASSTSPEKSKATKMTMTREVYKANLIETKPMTASSPFVYETMNITEFNSKPNDPVCPPVKSIEKICRQKSHIPDPKYCQNSVNIKPPFAGDFRHSDSEILVFGQSGKDFKVSELSANVDCRKMRCKEAKTNLFQPNIHQKKYPKSSVCESNIPVINHHKKPSELVHRFENEMDPCSSRAINEERRKVNKGTSFLPSCSEFMCDVDDIPVRRTEEEDVICRRMISLDSKKSTCSEKAQEAQDNESRMYEHVNSIQRGSRIHKGDVIHITCSPSSSVSEDSDDKNTDSPDQVMIYQDRAVDSEDPCLDADSPEPINDRAIKTRRDTRYRQVDIIQDNFTRVPLSIQEDDSCSSPERDPCQEGNTERSYQNTSYTPEHFIPPYVHTKVREACVSPVRMRNCYSPVGRENQYEDPCGTSNNRNEPITRDLKSNTTPKAYNTRPKVPPKISPPMSTKMNTRDSLKTVVAGKESFKESKVQIKTRLRPRSPPSARASPKTSKFTKNSADTLVKKRFLDSISENKELKSLRPRSPPNKITQMKERIRNAKELKPMIYKLNKKATRRISYSTKTGNRGYINEPEETKVEGCEPMYYGYNSKLRMSDPDWKPVDQAMKETYETDSDENELNQKDIEDCCGVDPGSSTDFDERTIYRMPKLIPYETQNGTQYQLCLDNSAHPVLVELTHPCLQSEIKKPENEFACQRTLSTIPEEDVETSAASNSAKEETVRENENTLKRMLSFTRKKDDPTSSPKRKSFMEFISGFRWSSKKSNPTD